MVLSHSTVCHRLGSVGYVELPLISGSRSGSVCTTFTLRDCKLLFETSAMELIMLLKMCLNGNTRPKIIVWETPS